jgi:hypothetical protein
VEVEKYLGRRLFVATCGLLVAAPVVYYTAFHFLGLSHASPPAVPVEGQKALHAPIYVISGSYLLISGLLISFATLYPDMDYFWGWIPLKWFAFGCVACGSITYFSDHDWVGLGCLWMNCVLGFFMVRSARGLIDFKAFIPSFSWLKPKPKFRVVPKPEPRPASVAATYTPPPASDEEIEVDALLDKIARSGLQSLTAAERERLEKARQAMLRKDR